MVKKLSKHGNSHALVIDKTMMEALGIDADTPLNVTISGDSIIVQAANVGVGRERVRESMRELRRRYGNVLKALAE